MHVTQVVLATVCTVYAEVLTACVYMYCGTREKGISHVNKLPAIGTTLATNALVDAAW